MVDGEHHFIKHNEKVTSVFGHWPRFHDAEVLSLRLERDGRLLFVQLYGFETARETDQHGYYRRKNECIVRLCFHDVQDLELDNFNHQNVIFELVIEKNERIAVLFHPSFGLRCKFTCKSMEVLEVVMLGPNGLPGS